MTERIPLQELKDLLFEIASQWQDTFDPAIAEQYKRVVEQLLEIDTWDGYLGFDLRIRHREAFLPQALLEKYDYWHIFNPDREKRHIDGQIRELVAQLYPLIEKYHGAKGDLLVEQYVSIFRQIAEHPDWDRTIEFYSLLPDELLPDDFLRKYPAVKAIYDM